MNERPLILRTIDCESTERVPLWFMRQAGRYLPEYRAIRKEHRMLDVIRTPELAFEVTMQPIRRFDLDAAIIFADILNPLMGLGIDLDFVEGEGPKIFNPISKPEDVARLKEPNVSQDLAYTFEAIKLCVKELQAKNIPLFGFAGAPFTLSAYLLEGGKLGDLHKTKQFMFSYPQAWHDLQEKILTLIVPYCLKQIESGASAIQIFDSWVGYLAANEYQTYVEPYLNKLFTLLKKSTPAPLMYFSTGSAGIIQHIKKLPVNGFSIDWRTSLSDARRVFGDKVVLQGNLDPLILAGPIDYLKPQVEKILNEGMKNKNYIFNLGHGIVPHTPPDNVAAVIEIVNRLGKY